jgi:hypothetical protein
VVVPLSKGSPDTDSRVGLAQMSQARGQPVQFNAGNHTTQQLFINY